MKGKRLEWREDEKKGRDKECEVEELKSKNLNQKEVSTTSNMHKGSQNHCRNILLFHFFACITKLSLT